MASECRMCRKQGTTNDEELCTQCQMLMTAAREMIEQGSLPRAPVSEFGITGRLVTEHGKTCALCGKPIDDDSHWMLVHRDPRQSLKADLRLHDLCHEIWEREATFNY